MKRMLLTAVMSSMLVVAAPAVASAHNGKRHHHASAHKRHAKRARIVKFGTPLAPTAASSPTQTTPTSGETAGTVTSFDKGVLTITLTNGTPVSGQVTEGTELECRTATPPPSTGDDDQGGGDDNGSVSGEHGGASSHGQEARAHASDNSSGDGQDDENGQQSCTTAALVPGAVVAEAELKLSSAGAVWEKVELVQ
jgi:hypothetical protein